MNLSYIFICFLDHAAQIRYLCQISIKDAKGGQKTFHIGEVWNLVCCHGNKNVKFILWSTSSRVLLPRIKHYFVIQIGWDIFVHHISSKSGSVSLLCHHLINLHIWKIWISPVWKEIFENSKQHSSPHTDYLFMY